MNSIPKPAPTSTASDTTKKNQVARLAYELWQNYGCPSGRDEMIWFEAERMAARSDGASAKMAEAEGNKCERSADEMAEDAEGLRHLDLITLPSDVPGRGPSSLP